MSELENSKRALEIGLNAIERLELPALTWGFVDASIGDEELQDAIAQLFEQEGLADSVIDTIDDLVDRKLVRFWYEDEERRYRSRFAEFVRLATRSRQLFPKRPWRAAPTLVSDYRLDISPRSYPRRDINPKDALSEISSSGAQFSALQNKIWRIVFPEESNFLLSRFQVEASRRIFGGEREQGTIITAGTGSGKTLAFYLPALIRISDRIQNGNDCTKILSLYPRNELLKDQLSEVYKLALSLAPLLKENGRRPIIIGALFGPVPTFASQDSVKGKGWLWRGGGHVCPYTRCPKCDSEMIWKNEDLDASIEKLHCKKCDFVTDPNQLRLTRQSVQKAPPDLLFSTTEMLNQRLSDTYMRCLFGVGCASDRKPSYILLDEVHTYVGTSGAQTSLLLRRWRALLGKNVHWVGLSATLQEASVFFSDLTGVYTDSISEITPAVEDLEEEGADYQLLLRTDPSSQAATLSTSIQTLMLLSRMLDPGSERPSLGLFGRRVFAFTDDLDVTHRLFDDLRDAEAYDRFGKPDDARETLANLRSIHQPEPEERETDGQYWRIAEELRGNLEDRLVIGRTTSRDPGVEGGADVVVATASLEVGFNDPDVGAVLQHKAPRSNASFVQRKGRAGRQRGMRPITVTVLSDFGRDQLAFQAYEQLFSPQIERQKLPVSNVYVLRMQAVCAMFDWIADGASKSGMNGWSWQSLSSPPGRQKDQAFRTYTKTILGKLMKLEAKTIEGLGLHLTKSLGIDEHSLRAILWEPPRPLLLEAVPTLMRRMFSDWKLAVDPIKLDLMIPYHPLPDFIPRQLFGELNLPEVQVTVPPARVGDNPKEESVRIRQALSEFSPGRVRRRFADEYGGLAHWFPVDPDQPDQSIQVSTYAKRKEYLGSFSGVVKGKSTDIRTFRPWSMELEKVNVKKIRPSSNSRWVWQSDFEFLGMPTIVDLPEQASWKEIIGRVEFYLHRISSAVTVRRFAHHGVATLGVGRDVRRIDFRLEDEECAPAAVGFAYEADGIVIPIKIPTPKDLASRDLPSEIMRWLRTLQFREAVSSDTELPRGVNSFKREWLAQITICASIQIAEENDCTLLEALDQLGNDQDAQRFERATAAVVAMETFDDERGDETRLEQTLSECLEQPGVIRRLADIAISTFCSTSDAWGEWLHKNVCSTIAEVILQACVLSTPKNTAIEGLTTDLIFDGDQSKVLVVESTLGGGGTIEALAERFANEPRAFFRAMDAALAPSDAENAASGLHKILTLLINDDDVRSDVNLLRSANNHSDREKARVSFSRHLGSRSVQYSQGLGVSFATRFVRPGATSKTDQLTHDLIILWRDLEIKYGLCLPVRIAASLSVINDNMKTRLAPICGIGNEISAANLLLWPQGGELRQYSLQSYNPYRETWASDAGLVRAIVSQGLIDAIVIGSDKWEVELEKVLAKKGVVQVTCGSGGRELRRRVLEVLSRPVVVNYLHLYPSIEGYQENQEGDPVLILTLREKA